ncbi:TPA: UDP-forming cellulose synthase catalytic subunit [Escherichia coli]|nr:UDP-forming cellulose synthase catalytic subunit [Escherichia coli]EEY5311427.1 UDP-forming cellulose synthase catalytic subunit [Escherichia coli]KUG85545.1 cellulose synthase [Escherichia coli]MBK2578917.1 UDP-forming cellulose synthase catalytic subunit [Escherichia coli]MCC4677281.1 UDP-forming cellulose synthase catalytic subunit [Escherichia coli]MCI4954848.1 UDP-forming cellulose synthase catalytic subunit [Escherichia coli]
MSILTRWLLIPPVNARLIGRYRDYRRHGASAFSATLGCFWMILAWIFIPLEHPRWQRIRAEHKNLYPHINASRPRPLDPVRYLIQTCWLLIGASRKETPKPRRRAFSGLQNIRGRYHQWMNELPERVSHKTQHLDEKKELGHLSAGARRLILGIIVTFSLILALICVTQPFNPLAQFIFLMLLWGVALIVRRMPGRFSALMLIVLSLTVSCRYIWWRYTSTLNWDDPVSLVCGLILLFAETYAWIVLVLGYFQVVWPLNRQPVPLPKDMSLWPSVDIFVPTYNEDLNVVKNTIYASLGIDWPKDKLNIWILDDGGREEFRQFAQNVGVKYIARTTHEHAKAGNINNALKYAKGEFVSIFDCDHVPTRSFLQMTMGWFLKEKQLAMMQTPHHFFSPDPFERNLGRFRKTPNEGTLFYGLVQDGNDMWDATFFCGSCAVIRRKPLDEIGGIAVETVTEDAHTSLRLHRRGYTSAYMRIPQAAGLATESLSAHIGQRIRWARGMVQIFRLDNPLTGKGLKFAQRLCYVNAMFHFLSGIPRLIFLTAPLAFLLLHAYIIYAPALMIALFVLPHMIHASLTNSKIQGKYRHSFWSEIYETVLAWYIAPPTLVALINPHKGKFNVTAKGGLVEEEYVDWVISRPYIFLVLLNLVGVAVGIWRYFYGPPTEMLTVVVSMVWVFYNLIVLGGAVAVSVESKQVRRSHRVEMTMPAAIAREDGHLFSCTVQDFSDGGLGIKINGQAQILEGQKVNLLLKRGQQEYVFPTQVARVMGNEVGLKLMPLTNQLRFDFEYMNPMPGGSVDNCITFQPVQNHVVIGDDSTIDFSKYYHFIPMPDLRAFANAGFPFSRMADLSQTITVMPKAPNEAQMETLLNTVGFIGAQTGFPAINLTVTDDGSTIQGKDADIMIIGGIPDKLKDDKQIDLLVQATESWVKTPMRQTPFPGIVPDESDRAAETRSTLTSSGAMAAVIGFQSPYNDQRSVIALLADSPRGYEMLNDAVNDSGKRATMFGSVAVIRESGINSLRVGDVYYVGHLPWFERLWYALANHPILLAVLAAISVILLAWVLWRLLRIISRRRLNPDNE